MKYKAIKLVKRPDIHITPDLFETVTLETPELEAGQVLLKQTHMSLDPAMKGWMMEDRNSYIPPVELGEVMRSSGIAEVVESKNDDYSAGDRLVGMIGWTEYAVSTGAGLQKLPPGAKHRSPSATGRSVMTAALRISEAMSRRPKRRKRA